MDYIDAIESCGRAPKTVAEYKKIVERLWRELGEKMFDLATLSTYLDGLGLVAGTRATYLWAVSAALTGTSGREEFERAGRAASVASKTLQEQQRKAAKASAKLAPVLGEYGNPIKEAWEEAERRIAKGTRPQTRKSGIFQQKIPKGTIDCYKSFVIDCKMKAQGPPPRSDFCNVYSSKKHADAAGGGSYYDSESGTIIFTSRVKDPNDVKEKMPFDVSGVREEINAFIDGHGHAKLLARDMNSKGYNSWIGDMTEQLGRCRMGTTVQRKMYVNQPEERERIEAQGEREARMGHSNRTTRRDYLLPKRERVEPVETVNTHEPDSEYDDSGSNASESESEVEEEPAPKRARMEKTELEAEAEEFADSLVDDMIYKDEMEGVPRF